MKPFSKLALVLAPLALAFSASATLAPGSLPTKAQGFFWGVANAAFQVEGSPVESDWTRWTHEKGRIEDGTNADIATDFWHKYDTDFSLAQELGANAFRVSIAWERIEPKKGVWDDTALAQYEKIIESMRAHGLEPMVTLQHFVLPAWLADTGGLHSPDFVPEFAAYSEKVVRRLAAAPAKVKWWMTFNEPMVLVASAYMLGEWPPGHKNDLPGQMLAAANIARAHIEAVRKIRALKQDVKISIAKHWRLFEGKEGDPMGWMIAKISDWAFNRQIISALMTGKIMFWMPGSGLIRNQIELPEGRPTLDFLGINYYGRTIVGVSSQPPFFIMNEGPGPKSDLGWEMYPEGMYKTLQAVKRYNLPVLITENGVADHEDKLRPEFVKAHLEQLMKARDEGMKVIGYLHWSLTDNFEWARGLTPRFGLVEIDYKTLERKPRPSFHMYRSLIR